MFGSPYIANSNSMKVLHTTIVFCILARQNGNQLASVNLNLESQFSVVLFARIY